MPLYIDRHSDLEVNADEAFAAHLLDVEVQQKYGVRYLTYWLDPKRGATFCLVEAPSREAAVSVHRESHGLIANEIIEVREEAVADFLGRIGDPQGTSQAQPIAESAFRTIVFTDIEGSTRMTQRLGDAGAMEILRDHNEIVRNALQKHGGSEVKHTGDGIMASFASVTSALESTIVIQRSL